MGNNDLKTESSSQDTAGADNNTDTSESAKPEKRTRRMTISFSHKNPGKIQKGPKSKSTGGLFDFWSKGKAHFRTHAGAGVEMPSFLTSDRITEIQQSLAVLNAEVRSALQLNSAVASHLQRSLDLIIEQKLNDATAIELSRALADAKQPVLASTGKDTGMETKQMFQARLDGLKARIETVFGPGVKLVDWIAGMNHCIAVMHDERSDQKFIIRRMPFYYGHFKNEHSFYHAYLKALQIRSSEVWKLMPQVHHFCFVPDQDDFLTGEQGIEDGSGYGLQLSQYFEDSENLLEKFTQIHQKATPVENIIYHATTDWYQIIKGLKELVKKGFYCPDPKTSNFIINKRDDSVVLCDFKTAFYELSDNVRRHLYEIETTKEYFRGNHESQDGSVAVGLLMCEVILTSFYECLTHCGPENQDVWKGQIELERLNFNGNALHPVKLFFVKWLDLLDTAIPVMSDLDYFEALEKDMHDLLQEIIRLSVSQNEPASAAGDSTDVRGSMRP